MALTQQDINEIFRQYVRQTYKKGRPCTITKTDIKNAITETETWINDNKASYNNTLNATFRSAESANEKSFLFYLVGKKIFDTGG